MHRAWEGERLACTCWCYEVYSLQHSLDGSRLPTSRTGLLPEVLGQTAPPVTFSLPPADTAPFRKGQPMTAQRLLRQLTDQRSVSAQTALLPGPLALPSSQRSNAKKYRAKCAILACQFPNSAP